MGKMDKLFAGASKAAGAAGKAAENLLNKGKTRLDQAALQNRIGRLQRQLGELVYTLMKTGQQNHALVNRYIEELDGLKEQLAEIQADEKDDISVHNCPECGAGAQKDAMFCSCCGNKLP